MSRQTRLGVEQAIELLEDSDVEGGWSESEDEDDGDETYLPDALELAQLEVEETDRSLNDSDMQHEQANLKMIQRYRTVKKPMMMTTVMMTHKKTDMSHSLVTVRLTVVMQKMPLGLLHQPQPLHHSLHLRLRQRLGQTTIFLALQV